MTPQNAWSLQLIDHIDAVIDGEPLTSTQRDTTQRKEGTTEGDGRPAATTTDKTHDKSDQPGAQPQEGGSSNVSDTNKTEAQQVAETNQTNFQLASCTLDASAQIYSARVDSVHKIAYEVLGGLSHAKQDDDDDDEIGEGKERDGSTGEDAGVDGALDAGADGDGDGDGDGRDEKRRAARKGIAATTLDTPENLDAPLPAALSNADYLFRKTTALMNRGGARSLFLSNCPARYGYAVLLEPEEVSKTKEEEEQECGPIVDPPGAVVDASAVLELLEGRDVNALNMCSVFREYSFVRGDVVRAGDDNASQETGTGCSEGSPEPALEIPDNPMPSAAFALLEDDDGDDNNGDDGAVLPSLLDLGSMDDEDGEGDNEEKTKEEEEEEENALPPNSQFSFFDPKVLRNWAGPSCWKFPVARAGPRRARTEGGDATETEDEAPRKRARKDRAEVFIDFTTPKKAPRRSLFEPPSKATTVLSDAALRKHTVEATTLPPDVHYDVSMLSRLFLNPAWHFTERHLAADARLAGRLLQRGGPMSQEWYECREAGILPGASSGSLSGCHGAGGDDSDNEGGEGNFGQVDASGDVDFGAALHVPEPVPESVPETPANTAESATQTQGLGELVQAPAVPQVTEVNYARSIKRMDAAAVKGALWKALCRLQPLPGADAPAEAGQEPVPFRALVAMLPALLPPVILAELTVAFCFVCLLHLCNERGVVLSTAPDTGELLASRRECAPAHPSA